MLKEKVIDCLNEFQNMRMNKINGDVMEIFNSLRNLIINDKNSEIVQDSKLYQSILITLNDMQEAVQEKRHKYYITTFLHIYSSNRNEYFKELEKYIIQYKNEKSEFEYENAYKNIIMVIAYLIKDYETYNHISKNSQLFYLNIYLNPLFAPM